MAAWRTGISWIILSGCHVLPTSSSRLSHHLQLHFHDLQSFIHAPCSLLQTQHHIQKLEKHKEIRDDIQECPVTRSWHNSWRETKFCHVLSCWCLVKTTFFTQELSNSCPIIKVKLSYKLNNKQQYHVMTGNDGIMDGLISQSFQLGMSESTNESEDW